MGYNEVADMAEDTALRRRTAAAYSQEQPRPYPLQPDDWAAQNGYAMASAPGWDAAWSSAIAAGNPDPGGDPAVITDAMVLSQTQAVLAGP